MHIAREGTAGHQDFDLLAAVSPDTLCLEQSFLRSSPWIISSHFPDLIQQQHVLKHRRCRYEPALLCCLSLHLLQGFWAMFPSLTWVLRSRHPHSLESRSEARWSAWLQPQGQAGWPTPHSFSKSGPSSSNWESCRLETEIRDERDRIKKSSALWNGTSFKFLFLFFNKMSNNICADNDFSHQSNSTIFMLGIGALRLVVLGKIMGFTQETDKIRLQLSSNEIR